MNFLCYSGILAMLFLLSSTAKVQAGCCSMDYKTCNVGWCGTSQSSCENCGGDAFVFLENGEVNDDCLARCKLSEPFSNEAWNFTCISNNRNRSFPKGRAAKTT